MNKYSYFTLNDDLTFPVSPTPPKTICDALVAHGERFDTHIAAWLAAGSGVRPIRLTYNILRTEAALRQPPDAYRADVLIDVNTYDEDTAGIYRLRYTLDLTGKGSFCSPPEITRCEPQAAADMTSVGKETGRIAADEYLLPILNKTDYDAVANRILARTQPRFLEDLCPIDAEAMAARMGLKLHKVRLLHTDCMGLMLFEPADIYVWDDLRTAYERLRFEAGTLLINLDQCLTRGDINATIAHECAHSYLNAPYCLLQRRAAEVCGDGGAAMAARIAPRTAYKSDAVTARMERQTEAITARILMPQAHIERRIDRRRYNPANYADVRLTERQLSGEFGVSLAMARWRMGELGYTPSMNYAANIAVRGTTTASRLHANPHGIGTDSRYQISRRGLLAAALRAPELASALIDGRLIYVDSRVSTNAPRYVERGADGLCHLTPYARTHLAECCAVFSRTRCIEIIPSGMAARGGREAADFSYELRRMPLGGDIGALAPSFSANADELRRQHTLFQPDFCGAVRTLMANRHASMSGLALDMGVDRRTVSRILDPSRAAPELREVVAVCVGLRLDAQSSLQLLHTAGYTLNNSPLHARYQLLLMNARELTVEDCNVLLKKSGERPLFEKRGE